MLNQMREREIGSHKDVVNELWRIQEVENKPLEMCMDVPLDLQSTKSITSLKGLYEENIL
jgi:hypothetical protein